MQIRHIVTFICLSILIPLVYLICKIIHDENDPCIEFDQIQHVRNIQPSTDDSMIDAVITWVDSTDPEWCRQKAMCEAEYSDMGDVDARDVRYPPQNEYVDAELRVCVQLILKHLSFIRKVHIVVARPQHCEWFSKYLCPCGIP